ncbi:hypothetical protein ACFX2A_041503 [Malus domestica]
MWDSTIRYDTENRWCGRSTIDRHRVNAGESSRCTDAAALPAVNDDQGISHVLGVSLAQCLCCLPSGTGFANFLVPMQLVPICELPCADAACAHFILQLHQSGLLKGDDMTDRFFRVFTELSVAYCLSSEMTIPGSLQTPQQVQNISFLGIDIYAKLVFLILKGSSKLFLLSKILAITVGFIQMDAEEKQPPNVPTFRLASVILITIPSLVGNETSCYDKEIVACTVVVYIICSFCSVIMNF